MKYLAVALLGAAALAQEGNQSTIRPVEPVPAALQEEYFRQAWVIEHAMRLQEEALRKIQDGCAKDMAEARIDGGLKWTCVPLPPKEEKK